MRRNLCLLLPVLFLLACTVPSAHAATFTVQSTADTTDASPDDGICATATGVCTLRAALVQANALPGPDTITLPAGTYNTATALPVTTIVTINGAGAASTVVDGAPGQNVFGVAGAGGVTFTGFTVTGGSRGIDVSSTELTLDRMAISGNSQVNGGNAIGAGMGVASSAKVFMTRSAVIGNTATSTLLDVQGAGIYVGGGVLQVETSTIAGNVASAPALGRASFGGGIAVNLNGSVTLRHVTMSGNSSTSGSAAQYGGNLYLNPGTTGTVTDSILTGGISIEAYRNCGPTKPIALGRNIDSGTTCGFGPGHLSSTDPKLTPLGDFGGPTRSAVPTLASPALGQAVTCPVDGIDQRGAAAPAGSGCDIGAAELSADLGVTLEASRGETPAGGDVTFVARVTNTGLDTAASVVLDLQPTGAAQVVLITPSTGSCTAAVRCELGDLAPGASATVTAVLRAGASGTLTPAVQVSTPTPEPAGASNSTAASVAVTTSPAPAGTAPASITPALRLSPLRLSGRARTGRAIRLTSTLSVNARLTLRVTRLLPGRRVGTSCRLKARRGTRCTAAVAVGVVTLRRTAGPVRLTIPAKLRGRSLPRGRYRVTAYATDASGRRSPSRTLTFSVSR